jgi:hypothetical protein
VRLNLSAWLAAAERATGTSVMAVEGKRSRDHEVDDPLVEGLVVRVDAFDQDLVRPRRQAGDDELLATGQILAGSSPLLAIKYQLVVVFMQAAATALAALLFVRLTARRYLTTAHQFRRSLL